MSPVRTKRKARALERTRRLINPERSGFRKPPGALCLNTLPRTDEATSSSSFLHSRAKKKHEGSGNPTKPRKMGATLLQAVAALVGRLQRAARRMAAGAGGAGKGSPPRAVVAPWKKTFSLAPSGKAAREAEAGVWRKEILMGMDRGHGALTSREVSQWLWSEGSTTEVRRHGPFVSRCSIGFTSSVRRSEVLFYKDKRRGVEDFAKRVHFRLICKVMSCKGCNKHGVMLS
uniref:Uncharacterized protein n=1 Tax=Setaria italica TaxID=4555 RepID=K3XZ60_SETIT